MAIAVLLVASLTAIAAAKWTVFRVGNLVLKVEGRISPSALPRDEFAPSSFRGRGEITTIDGSHPPALREGVIYVDRNGSFDPKGLPTCTGGQLEARDTKSARKVCGDSIIGTGKGAGEIAFPEQAPILVRTPLTIFNGGEKNGTITMFIHSYITVPTPAAVVTTFKFTRVRAGRYGWRGVFEVPVVAGGSGSIISFDVTLKRHYRYKGKTKSYDLGKCPDGRILLKGEGIFKDEAGDRKETRVSGKLILPCTPKG